MIQKRFVTTITSLGELDLSFWQDHLDELLDYMEEHDYCSDYRKKYIIMLVGLQFFLRTSVGIHMKISGNGILHRSMVRGTCAMSELFLAFLQSTIYTASCPTTG